MSEKSIVSMERKMCSVCGKEFDSGALLLQKTNINHPRLERYTTTGYGLCPEDKAKHDAGFIALVVIDESKSIADNGMMKMENAQRTGEIIHIKRKAFEKIFNTEVSMIVMSFIDRQVAKKLKDMTKGD
jgi:hypothetical protein